MKRLAYLSVLVLLVGVIPFAMQAKGKKPKIEICHFDDEGDSHVINVSENALNAHLSKHGDCTSFVENDDGSCSCDDDGDGVANDDDGCPNDPGKIDPGICGCGVADTDTDGDGTADCIDGCPNDPNKTDPGVCGCGVADTDSDGDTVPDCIDNFPNDPNQS